MAIEIAARLGIFAFVFAALAVWEILAPRRQLTIGRLRRWPSNFGVLAVDALLVRLLIPTAAVGAALTAAGAGWGLFNWLQLRLSAGVILGFLILDLTIWAQHWLFHHVPLLWRLHRMHHADLDIDVTTGVRFHPFEILISLAIKIAVIVAFGIPPVGVFVFEVALNATSMFNHSNARMPALARPRASAGRGDARHAPRASFDRTQRDRQQLRLQSAVVGLAVRHLPRASRRPATTA